MAASPNAEQQIVGNGTQASITTTSTPGTWAPLTTAAPGVVIQFSATVAALSSSATSTATVRTELARILGVSTTYLRVDDWLRQSKYVEWTFIGTRQEQYQNELTVMTAAELRNVYGFTNVRWYRAGAPSSGGSPAASKGVGTTILETLMPVLFIGGAVAIFLWYRKRQQRRREALQQANGIGGTPGGIGGLQMPVQQQGMVAYGQPVAMAPPQSDYNAYGAGPPQQQPFPAANGYAQQQPPPGGYGYPPQDPSQQHGGGGQCSAAPTGPSF